MSVIEKIQSLFKTKSSQPEDSMDMASLGTPADPFATGAMDQSSLTAVNVRGLLDLGSVYAMAMEAAAIFMVVFGLLLQRRKEYLTLRAYGLSTPSLLVLVCGEAMIVAACGLAAGIAVGVVMARLFVQVLRPLFILSPSSTIASGRLVVLGGVLLTSTMASGLFAVAVLRRLKPTTILREP